MKKLRNLSAFITCTIKDERSKKRELVLITKSLSAVNKILKKRFPGGYKILSLVPEYCKTVVIKQKDVKAYQCFSAALLEDNNRTIVFGLADNMSSFEMMCTAIAPEASIILPGSDEFALDTNYYVTEVNIGQYEKRSKNKKVDI